MDHGKCLRVLTSWVGVVKKGQNMLMYIIFEWSLMIKKYLWQVPQKLINMEILVRHVVRECSMLI